jgi:hypothetical protein
MSTPAWVLGTFAAVMILVAEVSAGQLVIARAWTRRGGAGADIAISHLLTGIAVAIILVPRLSPLPDAAWVIVFAVMTAWFAWRLWRESRGRGAAAVASGHYAPHLARSAAMLYLFAAIAGPSAEGSGMPMPGTGMPPDGSSGGMPALHAPTLALIFALLLIAFTVHDLDRGPASGAGPLVTVAPRQQAQADVAEPSPRASLTAHTAERLLLSPAVVKGCRVATGVIMAVTLIIMI